MRGQEAIEMLGADQVRNPLGARRRLSQNDHWEVLGKRASNHSLPTLALHECLGGKKGGH